MGFETISLREARRLALVRAGLLKPAWTGLPASARGGGVTARRAAHAIIRRFGYLQLDTVSIAGARSHALVLLSRLPGMRPALGEDLLLLGAPLFEYWGHEVCWLPLELYPTLDFRRREYRVHPWWGDVLGEHSALADQILRRIRDEGPIRSSDLCEPSSDGWWAFKAGKKVLSALWSAGDIAIQQRRGFQRTYDLTERVIPQTVRELAEPRDASIRALLLRALAGHGWATSGTLAATWRFRNMREELAAALYALRDQREITPCALVDATGKRRMGWVRPRDLELADRLRRARPRRDRGVLLSPFDPVL